MVYPTFSAFSSGKEREREVKLKVGREGVTQYGNQKVRTLEGALGQFLPAFLGCGGSCGVLPARKKRFYRRNSNRNRNCNFSCSCKCNWKLIERNFETNSTEALTV